MATRVDLNHFSLTQLNRPTPKTLTEIAYIILSPVQAVLFPILCLLSVQCNTLHGTEYKITCGVRVCVCVCVYVRTGFGAEYLENGYR